MKLLFIALLLFLSSCQDNMQDKGFLNLTGNKMKCWYIDFGENNNNIELFTIWCFSSDNEFMIYKYDPKTKRITPQEFGDYIPSNKFDFITKDTIILNGLKFPIEKLSKNEFILKEYSVPYFNDGDLYLRSCSSDSTFFGKDSDWIIEQIKLSKP